MASVRFNACVLRTPGGALESATVRGRLRGRDKALGNAVVVGDHVRFTRESGTGAVTQLAIAEVLPRRNAFSRRAPGREPVEQVMAANLDQVVIVTALAQPEFSPGFVDRVLAQCVHAGLPSRLVVNKTDLAPAAAVPLLADYAAAGVAGHALSARTREGIDALHEVLHGRRSLFLGHSGVGKSSLLNALEPGFDLLVGEVNAKTGKGRHTTTAAVLLKPERDVELIDTPGMRAFGLWGIEPDNLERAWPEFAPFLGRCRFGDCGHAGEPGCAIRAATERGQVAARRYESFLKLREELRDEERAAGPRGRRTRS